MNRSPGTWARPPHSPSYHPDTNLLIPLLAIIGFYGAIVFAIYIWMKCSVCEKNNDLPDNSHQPPVP